MANEMLNVRFVTVKGKKYLRAEDVAQMFINISDTEPTDTQRRLDEMAETVRENFVES